MDGIFAARGAQISCPDSDLDLTLIRAEIREALMELYTIRADVLVETAPSEEFFVGKRFLIDMPTRSGRRWFHGTCVAAERRVPEDGGTLFSLVLRPRQWLLGEASDCRIFQELSCIEIAKTLAGEICGGGLKDELSTSCPALGFTVQYRESALAYLSRLFEEHGLFFLFRQEEAEETLLVWDGESRAPVVPEAGEIVFDDSREGDLGDMPRMLGFGPRREFVARRIAQTDYDFTKVGANLFTERAVPAVHGEDAAEEFRYPGGYREVEDGERLTRTRADARSAGEDVCTGRTNVDELRLAHTFELTQHPDPVLNREYFITGLTHHIVGEKAPLAAGAEEGPYRCSLTAIPRREVPFRPLMATPRSRISGIQTAVVTGPAGEEIYTDRYGRVKLQFHWDRRGQHDENSSCWIRVSTPWAGQGWGSVAVPRIGQEVVVQFEEGDPDRPIVTGMLFNERNQPPYPLPGGATLSGLKSNSSPGGRGANEIQMEDGKDREALNVTAERDYALTVKNDANISVGFEKGAPGSMVQKVKQDLTEEVDAGNHSFTVKAGKSTVKIAAGRTETIEGGGDGLDVTGKRTVKASESYEVTTPKASINADNEAEVVSTTTTVTGKSKTMIGEAEIEVTGTTVKITGATSIELVSGPSSIKLDASGVTVAGPMVKLN